MVGCNELINVCVWSNASAMYRASDLGQYRWNLPLEYPWGMKGAAGGQPLMDKFMWATKTMMDLVHLSKPYINFHSSKFTH